MDNLHDNQEQDRTEIKHFEVEADGACRQQREGGVGHVQGV